jgi:hypothetical protein
MHSYMNWPTVEGIPAGTAPPPAWGTQPVYPAPYGYAPQPQYPVPPQYAGPTQYPGPPQYMVPAQYVVAPAQKPRGRSGRSLNGIAFALLLVMVGLSLLVVSLMPDPEASGPPSDQQFGSSVMTTVR